MADKKNTFKGARWRDFGIILVLLALTIFFMILSPNGFAQPRNLINVVKQASINGIIASGMMFVIINGGIDLSSGSTVALAGVITAGSIVKGVPLPLALLAGLLAGLLVGLVNGIGVAYASLPPFIITLSTMTGVRGLALIVSGGSPIYGLGPDFEFVASSFVFKTIPVLVAYFLVTVLLCGFILKKTVFGRHVYAVGGNEEAAAVSGVRVQRIRLAVYMISGVLSGLAGVLVASRTTQGSPTAGQGYEMDAIAAVVIGGISMSGGSGNWYGTIIGALLLAVMSSGLDILSVNSNYQQIIKGVIIAVAVYFDLRGKRNARK